MGCESSKASDVGGRRRRKGGDDGCQQNGGRKSGGKQSSRSRGGNGGGTNKPQQYSTREEEEESNENGKKKKKRKTRGGGTSSTKNTPSHSILHDEGGGGKRLNFRGTSGVEEFEAEPRKVSFKIASPVNGGQNPSAPQNPFTILFSSRSEGDPLEPPAQPPNHQHPTASTMATSNSNNSNNSSLKRELEARGGVEERNTPQGESSLQFDNSWDFGTVRQNSKVSFATTTNTNTNSGSAGRGGGGGGGRNNIAKVVKASLSDPSATTTTTLLSSSGNQLSPTPQLIVGGGFPLVDDDNGGSNSSYSVFKRIALNNASGSGKPPTPRQDTSGLSYRAVPTKIPKAKCPPQRSRIIRTWVDESVAVDPSFYEEDGPLLDPQDCSKQIAREKEIQFREQRKVLMQQAIDEEEIQKARNFVAEWNANYTSVPGTAGAGPSEMLLTSPNADDDYDGRSGSPISTPRPLGTSNGGASQLGSPRSMGISEVVRGIGDDEHSVAARLKLSDEEMSATDEVK